MTAEHRSVHEVPDAVAAALLFATDYHALGGVALSGMPGAERDRWLAWTRSLLPPAVPFRKVPVNVGADRLIGGLDVAATLNSGKPVFAHGILASTDGAVLTLSMAERLPSGIAAVIATALDDGEVRLERDGFTERVPARFGIIALDESVEADEALCPVLAERLALQVTLADTRDVDYKGWSAEDISRARSMLGTVSVPAAVIDTIAHISVAIGADSARGQLYALRAARVLAALEGRDAVVEADVVLAARLVLARRATRLPAEPAEPEPQQESAENDTEEQDDQSPAPETLDDVVLEAVRAALPAGLLAAINAVSPSAASAGRFGPDADGKVGRPVGTRHTDSLGGQRLNVLATLKAAAPWQRIRAHDSANGERRLRLASQDLRTTRFKERCGTTTLFVVDASGSQAAQRLGEVKGAIELLLSECYVRRDQVAMIAFRGESADLVLPPTRALARARRSLAGLAGGGATPLAAGIDAARELVHAIRRQGRVPAVVLMTDGRANVARDGTVARAQATEDATQSARLFRAVCPGAVLVDTSRRPRQSARELAEAMGATYLPLPHADARSISDAISTRAAA